MRKPKGLFVHSRFCLISLTTFIIISAGLLWAGEKIQKYTDATNKLSFSYPATWKEMTPVEARQAMGAANVSKYLTLLLYDPNDQNQNVNVQVLSPVAAQDISEAAYKEFAKRMDSDISGSSVRKISSKVGRLSDMAFLEYVMEQTRPDGVHLRQKQFRTGKAGREVAITFTSKAALYDKTDKMCFSVIIKTLRID